MGVSKSVTSRLKKEVESGNALQKHAGGHGGNTTPLEDRYVAFMAKGNRNVTPGQMYRPCKRYRYACFGKNHLTAIKSCWRAWRTDAKCALVSVVITHLTKVLMSASF
ncbi:hypothetical protein HNY73_021381 [Argiope bruennichi]|uniref:Uncharacterized protein n=1 Tax=Argiope bruennichi TaxID=94029 RepID=A0A8T0E1J9_ARGBR|nr:hypothetical protein HNY73_021381 [Argiope bruennichi]